MSIGRETFFQSSDQIWRYDILLRPADDVTTLITGRVQDAASGEPLADAVVLVVGSSFVAETDSTGSFRLTGTPPGTHRLLVRRVGYQPVEGNVELRVGRPLHLPGEMLALTRATAELDPITVEAEAPETRRPLTDFFERRKRGVGSFVTREEFERRGAPRLPTQVLARLRGIRVLSNPRFLQDGVRWIVTTTRGVTRAYGTPTRCPPIYFIDRRYIGNAENVDIDAVLPLVSVDAVEAYTTSAGLPQEFNRRGAACGVIAFWTR